MRFASLLLLSAAIAAGAAPAAASAAPRAASAPERLRVSAPVAATDDPVLLRAAEATLRHGGHWFTVLRRTEAAAPLGPRFSVGKGARPLEFPGGAGIMETGLGGPPGRTVTLELAVARGEARPSPTAYDARELAARLRPAAGAR